MLGIIDILWERTRDSSHRLRNGEPVTSLYYDAYTRYYDVQHGYMTHDPGVLDKIQDRGFVSDVAQLLRNDCSRPDVVSNIEQRLHGRVGVEYCQEIVCFTARLLVMMDVGRFMSEAYLGRNVLWDSSSLRKCVDDYFSEDPKMTCENVKLPKAFNAWSIESVGGIKVALTHNLADHLLLVKDDTTVLVFHHAFFLECQDTRYVLGDVWGGSGEGRHEWTTRIMHGLRSIMANRFAIQLYSTSWSCRGDTEDSRASIPTSRVLPSTKR